MKSILSMVILTLKIKTLKLCEILSHRKYEQIVCF
jgi:hypothetical protein